MPPGAYLLVAKGYNIFEQNGNALISGVSYPAGDGAGGAVSFGGTAYWGDPNATGFGYPVNSGNFGYATTFLAGTFTYVTAPFMPSGTPVTITASDIRGNVSTSAATVTVLDPWGTCSPSVASTSSATLVQVDRSDIIAIPQLKVYPNPTNAQFTVQAFDLKVPKALIQILNENGKIVEQKSIGLTGKTASVTVKFNLANQPSGMYFIKMISEEGVRTAKVIVQR